MLIMRKSFFHKMIRQGSIKNPGHLFYQFCFFGPRNTFGTLTITVEGPTILRARTRTFPWILEGSISHCSLCMYIIFFFLQISFIQSNFLFVILQTTQPLVRPFLFPGKMPKQSLDLLDYFGVGFKPNKSKKKIKKYLTSRYLSSKGCPLNLFQKSSNGSF